MSQEDDVFLFSEGEESSDEIQLILHSRKLLDSFNRPRLSFCQPSNKNPKSFKACFSTEELPDLTPGPHYEPSVKTSTKFINNEQPTRKLTETTSQDKIILKPCSVPLIRCDDKDPGFLQSSASHVRSDVFLHKDKRGSKNSKIESVEKSPKSVRYEEKAILKRKANAYNNSRPVKRPKDQTEHIKFKIKQTTLKEICFQSVCTKSPSSGSLITNKKAVTRKRILEERQAVSDQIEYSIPLAIFHQPSPIRKNLHPSRISYHRQAFSSPLKDDFIERATKRQVSPIMCLKSQFDRADSEPEKFIQIFHRTVKRAPNPEFDLYIEDSHSQPFLNQMMNLERNIIFGQYWHVYIPNFQFEKFKQYFTEYHEAFVEAALEQEENPVGEALSFLKDFQSRRCPTPKSISGVVDVWKKSPTLYEKEASGVVRVLSEIFESYPEVAKAFVDKSFMSLISKNIVQHPESSLVMTAVELDFFTRTLCDSFSIRRSLIFSFLSIWKNRESLLGITHLIKDNIKTCAGIFINESDQKTARYLDKGKIPCEAFPKTKPSRLNSMFDEMSVADRLDVKAVSFSMNTATKRETTSNQPNNDNAADDLKHVTQTSSTENVSFQCRATLSFDKTLDTNLSSSEMYQHTGNLPLDENIVKLNGDEGCRKGREDKLNYNNAVIKKHDHMSVKNEDPSLPKHLVAPHVQRSADSSARLLIMDKMAQELTTKSDNEVLDSDINKTSEKVRKISASVIPDNNFIVSEDEHKFQRPHADGDISNNKKEVLDPWSSSTTTNPWGKHMLGLGVGLSNEHLFSHASTRVTNIHLYQRLLALVMGTSISQKNVVTGQIAELLVQVYLGVSDLLERQLLLASVASPLLTSCLAKRLLLVRGYLLDSGGAWSEDTWSLSFQDEIEFLTRFTPTQQEEFSMLFYYNVWGVLETSKHNMLKSRSDCLLNFGLSPEYMPHQLQLSTRQLINVADKLSDQIGHTTQLFLNLTKCLFETRVYRM